MTALTQKIKNQVNKALKPVNAYHESIPMDLINEAFKAAGLILVDIDDTELSVVFCGREGRAILNVAPLDAEYIGNYGIKCFKQFKNNALTLTWYKINTKYEIVAYFS